jgi:hypothetical protein
VKHLKHLLVALGLSVVGLIALAPSNAFARGGGFHGGGFHGGGGFHAAPAFRGGPVYRGGYRAAMTPRFGFGPRHYGPVGAYRFGRTWVPGYWGWNSGARVWIAGAYATPPNVGWIWIAPQWRWNGGQWVWQGGYWAPPQY